MVIAEEKDSYILDWKPVSSTHAIEREKTKSETLYGFYQ